MATKQQVTLAARYFSSLDPQLQHKLVERVNDLLEFPSPQQSALLKELDRLAELMRSHDQDPFLERELTKRRQSAAGTPASALRFVLRNIPLETLIEDVAWPHIKELMETLSGFGWGTPSFEDPSFFWPHAVDPKADLADLDDLWLKETVEPKEPKEPEVEPEVEPVEPVEPKEPKEPKVEPMEEPVEEIKSVQGSKRTRAEELNPKAKKLRGQGLSFQVEGEALQVAPDVVVEGQTFLAKRGSGGMAASLQRGTRVIEFPTFGVYHTVRMENKTVRVQVIAE